MTAEARTGRRVGVLTFHRCINYGSYWQARSLVEGLRRRGADAVLIDHHSARVNRAEWRCALQPTLPARTPRSDFPLYAGKARKFFEAFAQLPRSSPFPLEAPEQLEPFDTVVVGSDEVWNLRHPWYSGVRLFFGQGLKADRLVSYAASFGNHDAADGLDPGLAEGLRGFAALSVRDDNSQQLVQGALGRAPALVLDPCLQFPDVVTGPSAGRSDRVIVYGHSFPEWLQARVRRAAARRGLRLVSVGYRNDWADEQRISAGPVEFARLMAEAAGVVTNFFHGCVFAVANTRPLLAALSDYRSNKVQALARSLGLEDRLVTASTPPAAYEALLERPPLPRAERRIALLRERSEAYLDHALA